MKPTPTHFALTLIAFVLIAATGILRFKELSFFERHEEPKVGPKSRFCVGIEHPEIDPGLVCALGPDRVIAEAIRHLDLPSDCGQISLPSGLKPGERIVLADLDGRCVLQRTERLPGALRLLCGAKLNVNLENVRDLTLLPGIGEVKARRIVENRLEHGPFVGREDLTRVHGIGSKTVKRLEPWLEW
ncbi:MAG: helix-hairpin-helix domain-containing protein [Proteobacteria bacterium]|nr:helix-hairpin-helix domain-containing protein [Pseudomonadota bacterium]